MAKPVLIENIISHQLLWVDSLCLSVWIFRSSTKNVDLAVRNRSAVAVLASRVIGLFQRVLPFVSPLLLKYSLFLDFENRPQKDVAAVPYAIKNGAVRLRPPALC